MSDIIFKINKPLTLKSGTGVTLSRDGVEFFEKDFDGSNNANVVISIGQGVGTTDDVQFNAVSLTSGDSLNIGSPPNLVISDGSMSGTTVKFKQNLVVTQSLVVTGSVLINGPIASGSGTFGSKSQTVTHNTGSTRWGENTSQKQFFSGSLDVTGSIRLNTLSTSDNMDKISNDTSLSGNSRTTLVTENVAKTHLATIKPDRDYLRKSFAHTGSFVNSSTASFSVVTASAPTSLTATSEDDFMFFINGMVMENDALTIQQKSATLLELRLNTNSLGYSLDSSDEVIGFGKFNS